MKDGSWDLGYRALIFPENSSSNQQCHFKETENVFAKYFIIYLQKNFESHLCQNLII